MNIHHLHHAFTPFLDSTRDLGLRVGIFRVYCRIFHCSYCKWTRRLLIFAHFQPSSHHQADSLSSFLPDEDSFDTQLQSFVENPSSPDDEKLHCVMIQFFFDCTLDSSSDPLREPVQTTPTHQKPFANSKNPAADDLANKDII
jgi:hypothetical protein